MQQLVLDGKADNWGDWPKRTPDVVWDDETGTWGPLGASVDKHLFGRHDQKTHGKGGSKTEGSDPESPAAIADAAENTTKLREDVARRADSETLTRGAGSTSVGAKQAVEDQNAAAIKASPEAMAQVRALGAEEIPGTDPRVIGMPGSPDGHGTYGTPVTFTAAEVAVAEWGLTHREDGSQWPYPGSTETVFGQRALSPEVAAAYDAEIHAFDPVKLKAAYTTYLDQVRATPGFPGDDELMVRQAARDTVDSWAQSAGDSSPRSWANQRAIANALGTKGDTGPGKHMLAETRQNLHTATNAEYARTGKIREVVAKATYDRTQAHLRELGIGPDDPVYLTRGVTIDAIPDLANRPAQDMAQDRPAYGSAETYWEGGIPAGRVSSNAATSWATDSRSSAGFGNYTLLASVPARSILSTPATGYGCLSEYEVVVLGSDYPIRVATSS